MYQAAQLTVYVSPFDQFSYFLAHQPLVLSLVLAYGAASLLLYWFTRGRGFLIAMLSGLCYLAPMVMRLAAA